MKHLALTIALTIALSVALSIAATSAHAQSRKAVDDDVDRFALDLFDRIQPKSIAENREYCGYIGFDAAGVLTATPARPGDTDSCDAGEPPAGLEVLASYHTHGAFLDDADSEVPSLDDLLGDMEEEIDGYVATPGGRVWLNLSLEKLTFQVCGRGCVTADPKARPCKSFTPLVEYSLREIRQRENSPVVGC